MRTITRIALIIYAIGGIFSASFMKMAIPALNWIGVLYVGLTWPISILLAPFGLSVIPPQWIANYMFF